MCASPADHEHGAILAASNGRDLTFKDTGETLFMGSSGTGAPYELSPDNVEEDEAFGQRGRRR